MSATTAYFIFRVIVAFVLAAVAYVADRRLGTGLYRWWYNMTHEHPMEGESTRGLLYNQPSKVRATWAVVIATLVTVLSFLNGSFYPLLELGLWAASVPAAFAGLLVGPRLHGLWLKRDRAFHAVDRWERGELDLSDELKARTAELGEKLKGAVRSLPDEREPGGGARETESAPRSDADGEQGVSGTPAAPEGGALETADPQELVNRYVRRAQGGQSETGGTSGQQRD